MPKSKAFINAEAILTSIKKSHNDYIKAGKKEFWERNLDQQINKFISCLDETLLVERNIAGNILMLVITALPPSDFSDALEKILPKMLAQIQQLSTEQRAKIYSTKADGLSLLKLAATENPALLEIMLPEVCSWGNPSQLLQILTGMDNQEDTNVTAYTRNSIANLMSKLTSLDDEQRGNFLTARDDSDDNWNALAYAYAVKSRKDSELIKALLQRPEVFEADPLFLSDPTNSSRVNADIFIYMLSQLSLVAPLQKLEDLSTLKKMLTTRGVDRKNALAIVLENAVYSKHLGGLLALIQRLDIKDQQVVLNQLTTEEQTTLAAILVQQLKINEQQVASSQLTAEEQETLAVSTACHKATLDILKTFLPQRSRTPTLFNAVGEDEASAAADYLEEPEDGLSFDELCLTRASTPS